MPKIVNVSEAANLALHTMGLLAENTESIHTTKSLAQKLNASEAHLSKVLQRLTRYGLVQAVRGPKGGFNLTKPAEAITLLEIYQAIDGEINVIKCLFSEPICKAKHCPLGNMLNDFSLKIADYLADTNLKEFALSYKGGKK